MEKNDNPVVQEILNKLARLSLNEKIEPVKAILPGNKHGYMERIVGTAQYLLCRRGMILETAFKDMYYHTGKIPEGCIVVDNMILRIEDEGALDNPEHFLEILNKIPDPKRGAKFYLDDQPYLDHVCFAKCDEIRDKLLQHRRDGTMIFDVLKIVELTGNVTEFYASPAVQKRMDVARELAKQEMMINHD